MTELGIRAPVNVARVIVPYFCKIRKKRIIADGCNKKPEIGVINLSPRIPAFFFVTVQSEMLLNVQTPTCASTPSDLCRGWLANKLPPARG